jgi:hypothetical protein
VKEPVVREKVRDWVHFGSKDFEGQFEDRESRWTTDAPTIVKTHQKPFERMPALLSESRNHQGLGAGLL